MKRWLRDRVHTWIYKRGVIPFWAYWIWPKIHWCPGLDGYLSMWHDTCYCDLCPHDWRMARGDFEMPTCGRPTCRECRPVKP